MSQACLPLCPGWLNSGLNLVGDSLEVLGPLVLEGSGEVVGNLTTFVSELADLWMSKSSLLLLWTGSFSTDCAMQDLALSLLRDAT